LCVQCCQCLWIVHCWLPLQYSLRLVWPMLILKGQSTMDNPETLATLDTQDEDNTEGAINNGQSRDTGNIDHARWRENQSNVASVSGLSIVDCPFSILFVLCVQCCQCLWIVHCWLPLQYYLRLVWPLLPVSLDCPLRRREYWRGNQQWTIQRHWQ
jgi:hypothetical protein